MSKHRFYQPGVYQAGAILALNEKNTNHIERVLRLKEGENISLFNGKNQHCVAQLVTVGRKKVEVTLGEVVIDNKESPLNIHLIQALSKGERFDLVVQKAVELGVHQLTPVLSQRNVVKLDKQRQAKKYQHWQGIIESASEQCGRNVLMQLNPIMTLTECIHGLKPSVRLMLDPYSNQTLISLEKPLHKQVSILIGPEGGFTNEEVELAKKSDFLPITFGRRILRTETAAIASCAVIQSLWGDLV